VATVTLRAIATILKFGTSAVTGSATNVQLNTGLGDYGDAAENITAMTSALNSASGTLTQIIGNDENNALSGPVAGKPANGTISSSIAVSSTD
jgi:hypothetical protein